MTPASAVRPEARNCLPARNSLKVISYNILAPRYANYNSYCPPQFLAWEYRRAGVLREMDHLAADLLGLQECDKAFFRGELQGWMSQRGMCGEFLERSVGPVPGPPEGIALLWRDAALEMLTCRHVLYGEMDPRVAGLPAEVAGSLPWSKLRELGEGAVMALLRHRPSGRLLVAAVTHLFWNPAFPDVKALQAALLCGSLAAFSREAATGAGPGAGSVAPGVVLFGDFNSLARKWLPDRFDPQVPPGGLASGVYTLLTHGSLPPDHPDHPATRVWEGAAPTASTAPRSPAAGAAAAAAAAAAERFPAVPLTSGGLQLVSLNVEAFGREPPLTTRTSSWAGCIDFVWISRGDFSVASGLAMPYDDGGLPPLGPAGGASGGGGAGGGGSRDPTWRDPLTDIAFTAIPNEFFPSDHLAVGGEVLVAAAAAAADAATAAVGGAGAGAGAGTSAL
ncbi:hypothetical protein PLESTB_001191800 [Pleodorina starrii]|uniref:Endonuclease/exonuclease/phosphatase domain-containing protein n=1 Tax=Pleodorina starrii TaxID=330485 RepID=A0A9W6BTC4_9CHLO|nr:hypothetical protein PLESTB_001191800 [Pleodorina starrii]GLC71478.1 hypothetical protein PLESTF_001120200 [Pleodorina starrii]